MYMDLASSTMRPTCLQQEMICQKIPDSLFKQLPHDALKYVSATSTLFRRHGRRIETRNSLRKHGSNCNTWEVWDMCQHTWSTYLPTYPSIYGSTVRCWTLAVFFPVSWFFTRSVGLLERGISPSEGRYLQAGQHKHRIYAHRHPCVKWDSTPRSQRLSGRRQFMH
jgi:hypothetical protein